MKEFGMQRVVEPRGTTPVSAWKIDNDAVLRKGEVKIKLKTICFERENINQIYSSCDYNEEQVKHRIMKIVEERGKLHNPYTNSSGVFTGTILEASEDFDLESRGLKYGDEVICAAPMGGMPMNLLSVDYLHYYYGQADVTGYAICYETTRLKKVKPEIPYRPLLRAVDQEGAFNRMGEALKQTGSKSVALIAGSMSDVIFHAKHFKMLCGEELKITAIGDISSARGKFKQTDVAKICGNLIDEIRMVDVSDPAAAADCILNGSGKVPGVGPFDSVFNLEHIAGAASLATFIVKDGGFIGYTSTNSQYTTGLLLADCMGKEISNYVIDGYHKEAYDRIEKLVAACTPHLMLLDQYYTKIMKKKQTPLPKEERTQIAAQTIDGFVYRSPQTAQMIDEVLNVAKYDCNVIIQGETGVGKERVFDLLHANSSRNGDACVRINCATIQENLAESEFFGYEKGAFTGASNQGKIGYFEMANNGTLFLDEIGTLSLDMQAKLLRVLQESTFYKVGGTTPIHVNVRIIVANNIPLKKLIKEGKFREDLYYRLAICEINVPPLRYRPEDIRCLSDSFLEQYSSKYGIKKTFSDEAYNELEAYHWPGNVRELENTIHRLYISNREDVIDRMSVSMIINDAAYGDSIIDIKREFKHDDVMNFDQIIEDQERRLIEYALKKEGTTRKAATFLSMSQGTFARKKLKYGL